MCAIAGLWMPASPGAPIVRDWAAAMADRMRHRGPDGEGVWWDPRLGLALAHRRLAIRDTAETAGQPMEHPTQRSVLVFNGELDNHRAWRSQLRKAGCAMGHRGVCSPAGTTAIQSSQGDTEVLLHALDRWGVERVCQDAHGMWAWAWWDASAQRLTLSRDRLGKKPLYWMEQPWGMAFASQLQALRCLTVWSPRLNPGALADYLRWGFLEGPDSIFDGVHRVEPGQTVTFERARCVARRRYWSASHSLQVGAQSRFRSAVEAQAAVMDALRDAVKERMQADVPIGAFLSGGVDSALVMAVMRDQGVDVQTFCSGFDSPDYDESPQAARIAAALGSRHETIAITGAMAAGCLPDLPRIMDEPLADASLIPTTVLAQHAASSVKVVLTGDGGDEAFGGYVRYRMAASWMRLLAAAPRPFRSGLAGVIEAIEPGHWDTAFRWLASRHRPTLPASKADKLVRWLRADDDAQRLRTGLQRWEPRVLWPGAPMTPLASVLPAAVDQASGSERMQLMEMRHYLCGDLLAKMDRATMWAGLEARSPLLDHRVVDLAWRVPPGLKAEGPRLKELLRRCLEHYLPRELFDRPKRGFSAPLDHWLRAELRETADQLLRGLISHVAGRWNTQPIQQAWVAQQSGSAHHVDRLWTLMILEQWRREWNVDLP